MNSCNNKYENYTECELLMKISELQFVAIELNLYINTHPNDMSAKADYRAYSSELLSAIRTYEKEFGPLLNFGHSDTETGCWVYSKWPWE